MLHMFSLQGSSAPILHVVLHPIQSNASLQARSAPEWWWLWWAWSQRHGSTWMAWWNLWNDEIFRGLRHLCVDRHLGVWNAAWSAWNCWSSWSWSCAWRWDQWDWFKGDTCKTCQTWTCFEARGFQGTAKWGSRNDSWNELCLSKAALEIRKFVVGVCLTAWAIVGSGCRLTCYGCLCVGLRVLIAGTIVCMMITINWKYSEQFRTFHYETGREIRSANHLYNRVDWVES